MCRLYFVWKLFGLSFGKLFEKRDKHAQIKLYKAPIDASRSELFILGLGSVVALWVCWQIIFCLSTLDVKFRRSQD